MKLTRNTSFLLALILLSSFAFAFEDFDLVVLNPFVKNKVTGLVTFKPSYSNLTIHNYTVSDYFCLSNGSGLGFPVCISNWTQNISINITGSMGGGEIYNGTFNETEGTYVYNSTPFKIDFNLTAVNNSLYTQWLNTSGSEVYNGTFNETEGTYVYNSTPFKIDFNETRLNATCDSRINFNYTGNFQGNATNGYNAGTAWFPANNASTNVGLSGAMWSEGYFANSLYAMDFSAGKGVNATTFCIDAVCITNWSNAGNASLVYYADETYINKNSSDSFNLNETYLNATIDARIPRKIFFNATSISTLAGTPDIGVGLSDITQYDDVSYNVTEKNGATPVLTVSINFSSVSDFNGIMLREYYSGSASHHIKIQLWDYVANSWQDYYDFIGQAGFNWIVVPVADPENHNASSLVQLRLYHVENGIASHKLFIDVAWLVHNVDEGVTITHDSLSGRDNLVNHPQYLDINGTRNVTTLNVTDNASAYGVYSNYFCLPSGECISNWTQAGNASSGGGDYSPWTNDSNNIYQKNTALGLNVTNNVSVGNETVNTTITNDSVVTRYVAGRGFFDLSANESNTADGAFLDLNGQTTQYSVLQASHDLILISYYGDIDLRPTHSNGNILLRVAGGGGGYHFLGPNSGTWNLASITNPFHSGYFADNITVGDTAVNTTITNDTVISRNVIVGNETVNTTIDNVSVTAQNLTAQDAPAVLGMGGAKNTLSTSPLQLSNKQYFFPQIAGVGATNSFLQLLGGGQLIWTAAVTTEADPVYLADEAGTIAAKGITVSTGLTSSYLASNGIMNASGLFTSTGGIAVTTGNVIVTQNTSADNASFGSLQLSRQSSFSAYNASAFALSTTTGRITFATELWDTNADYATPRFTAKVSGVYSACAQLDCNNVNGQVNMTISQNGLTNVTFTNRGTGVGLGVAVNGCSNFKLAVSGTIEVYGWSSAAILCTAGQARTWFTVTKIA